MENKLNERRFGDNRDMKTVFTNGVFDLFHYGHYLLLKRLCNHGDYIIVGVCSDESCIKGKRKPMCNWKKRADVINNLKFVDEVIETPFGVDLTEEFYNLHKIDVQVQGDNYSPFPVAEKLGILNILGRTKGVSTSYMIPYWKKEHE